MQLNDTKACRLGKPLCQWDDFLETLSANPSIFVISLLCGALKRRRRSSLSQSKRPVYKH